MNLAFASGDAARDHVRALGEERARIAEALNPELAVPNEREKAERDAVSLEIFRSKLRQAEAFGARG